jgi:hypothetical protein
VAAHDALVGVLEGLDAVAAAVLGGLAGDLGARDAVRERVREFSASAATPMLTLTCTVPSPRG